MPSNLWVLCLNTFSKCVPQVCEIEFGFKENEIQHIVLTVPKVLAANKRKLTQIFDLLHNTMEVPHHLIVKFPQVDLMAVGCLFFAF